MQTPEFPAVSAYPTEGHADEVSAAKALFEAELASDEGWEDMGEREGVQLFRKLDPEDAYAVPLVKGEAVVTGVTSEQFLATIQLPGMRKRWDPRFETGFVLERFARRSYSFYSLMKGMGWLVYPRDICGQQQIFEADNGEIVVIQTSIVDADLAPEQSGKTRATLDVSGWQLLPQGDDLKVTYIVKVALNGSIPSALVQMLATETPLCVGRARDVYHSVGHPPYVLPTVDAAVIFHNESLADPGVAVGDRGTLEYRITFQTAVGATFDLAYGAMMYPDGVTVSVEGEGVETADDGAGKVTVTCTGSGQNVVVVILPKTA